ncbi:hypothetical protein GCM10009566_43650 [Streptomyces murinus]|uniref:Uncharacterized protein n=1 Tax=Streptomyces murinus TaxID=33900 RepID=A0A7W3NI46_STRMR|nr:hypothetical protein [Streptomyces murinus]MBA9050965.1 hypothetical protein [Streptomyces murinus]
MLIRETTFTVEVGEHGYFIGFDDDYDFPSEMPFGWRCGSATPANAVVLPTTDTGTLQMTVQLHDSPPDTEPGDGWEPAEEMSLLADTPTLHVATIGQGDFWDAWPEEEPPLDAFADGDDWVRMRLYCRVDDFEPGIGDRGERHLIQLWPAPQTPPVHPDISEADRQARADYAADTADPVDDYTAAYPYTYSDEAN